ncbi:MAG TPA: hypothetical protein VF270_12630, partial [Ignavibacteriaceae bacterium]
LWIAKKISDFEFYIVTFDFACLPGRQVLSVFCFRRYFFIQNKKGTIARASFKSFISVSSFDKLRMTDPVYNLRI